MEQLKEQFQALALPKLSPFLPLGFLHQVVSRYLEIQSV